MVDSDREPTAREKIMAHRRTVMIGEAKKDDFLGNILANGQRSVVEGIVDEVVRDESNSTGLLMKSDRIVSEIKRRWTERQEAGQSDTEQAAQRT